MTRYIFSPKFTNAKDMIRALRGLNTRKRRAKAKAAKEPK